MKITVTGSLGTISRPLVEQLVASGHQVTVISSTPDRKADIEALKATPLIGSVDDSAFVLSAFQGSDAAYLMIPPNFRVPDYAQFTRTVLQNYHLAIQEAEIKKVVNLSSVGSALAGAFPLKNYQDLELALDQIPAIQVTHLRPGGFYSNFYGSMGLIREQGIIGNNFGGHVPLSMSHPKDIADAALEAFNSPTSAGKNIINIVSDTKTGDEIATILGQSTGRADLKWVEFTDHQLLEVLVSNGFSADAAQDYLVDMGIAIRVGLLEQYYQQNTDRVYGKRSLAEFATEFARIYKGAN